jgi:error-prone DNA polymerase
MCENGYSVAFAETCLHQIQGFSEYGFPESHAASFALLVYASAWIKRHYPAEFACALLNSQPMGFYEPAQIIRDAQKHGVVVAPIDANHSSWDCSVTYRVREQSTQPTQPVLRLGLRLVRGLRHDQATTLEASRAAHGTPYSSLHDLWNHTESLSPSTLTSLARADAFSSFERSRRHAHWDIQALPPKPAPLDTLLTPRADSHAAKITPASEQREMFQDYASTGFSLRAHPVQYLRDYLTQRRVCTAETLSLTHGIPVSTKVSAAGLAITRQRPGTAKGVVFITLEDETGSLNLIIRPALFEQHHKTIMHANMLLARGKLERIGEIVYIDVDQIRSLDAIYTQQS